MSQSSPTQTASQLWSIYLCGATILAAIMVLSHIGPMVGSPQYLGLLGVACMGYLAAMHQLRRSQPPVGTALLICLALALVWRIPMTLSNVGDRSDVYRYLWDARLQRLGYSPYTIIPADPRFAFLHTPETRRMNNPDVPSSYPPGAQWAFRIITSFSDSVRAFKIAFLLCDLLIMGVLIDWLRYARLSLWWVLAYAWNPLVSVEGTANLHLDPVGVLFLTISFTALARGKSGVSMLAFAVAVAVKYLPIVLAPLFWRRVRFRDAAVSLAAFSAMYLPFIVDGGWPTGSLAIFIERFRFNHLVFGVLEPILDPRALATLALLVGIGTAALLRFRTGADSPAAWAWPMAAALVCAPVIYPWYLYWLAPFLTVPANVPLMIWTVSILPTYVVHYLYEHGSEWVVPWWVLLLEYGSLAAAAVSLCVSRIVRPKRDI